MKKTLAALFFVFIFIVPQTLKATPEMGIILGDPTGFSFEYQHIQGGLGWDLDKMLHINVDYLFYFTSLTSSVPLELYIGAGAALLLRSSNTNKDERSNLLGARLPIGISYLVKAVPLRIFLQVSPTMYIIDKTDFDPDWGLGVRYVF